MSLPLPEHTIVCNLGVACRLGCVCVGGVGVGGYQVGTLLGYFKISMQRL